MPRGRRRRGGRKRRPQDGQAAAPPSSGPANGAKRRRRRRSRRGPQPSALDQMIAEGRPGRVQTLPPDGTVLEEVISSMQQEHGTPTTPQEFRLLIKVPGAEAEVVETEPEDTEEIPPEEESPSQPGPAPSSGEVEVGGRSHRRRRRNRASYGQRDGSDGRGPSFEDPTLG